MTFFYLLIISIDENVKLFLRGKFKEDEGKRLRKEKSCSIVFNLRIG